MEEHRTFIIAEVGINHNGDVDLAKKLILAAKYAGVDAIKFQKRTIDKVYTKEELDKPRESPYGTTNRDQKNGLELNSDEYDEINILCRDVRLPWFVSPWDLESVDFIQERYNPPFWKIPSALIVHTELCEKIAKIGKKTFIACGMSTYDEIDNVVKIFDIHECDFELMHCNSQYPMPDKDANLHVISSMRQRYSPFFLETETSTPYCKGIGYSGHEVGIITSVAAVAIGAISIERHITLDRAMYGSDQAASIEPDGFRRMVDYIRTVESAMGYGIKTITEGEEKAKSKLRRYTDIITV